MRLLTIGLLITLLVSACSLGSSNDPVEADIVGPPVVTIAQGIASAPYQVGVTVDIQAAVSNAGGTLDRVEFAVDSQLIATLDEPNPDGALTFNVAQPWQADAAGVRSLRVSAIRDDGSRGDATVRITIVASNGPISATSAVASTANPAATSRPTVATQSSQPTVAQATVQRATATSSVPIAVFDRNQNVRNGPDTNFDRIGTFAPGQQAEILALNLDETWYKVRFQGGQAWVYAPLVQLQGSTTGLSREAGPPTPIPPPTAVPTAVPPTSTSAPSVNLTIENFTIAVPSDGSVQPKCGVPFVARFTIRNSGQSATSTGAILIENVHLASNTVNGSSGGALVPVNLEPGATHTVETALTIDTFFGEQQRVIFRADANNQVAETNEDDNQNGITYTLEQGGCG